MFVGQRELRTLTESWTWQTMPNATLFLGERGCGKHTLAAMLAEQMQAQLVCIAESVQPEDIVAYQCGVLKTLYYIDLSLFTQKQQNQFLKFIEEPPQVAKIIIGAQSDNFLLPTIANRCVRFKFSPYSVQQLKEIKSATDETVYKLCTTPGQLLTADLRGMSDLLVFCERFAQYVPQANFANTLSIANKINYKEEYDKFDFELFFKAILLVAQKHILTDTQCAQHYYALYDFTQAFYRKLYGLRVNKEQFVLSYLTGVWQEMMKR